MREIKFRGKRKDNGKWAYGYLVGINMIYQILNEPALLNNLVRDEVIPKTVGQYTGLKDEKGKEIYEGDIVVCTEMHDSNVFDAWTDTDGFDPNTKPIPFKITKDKDGVDWIFPSDLRRHPEYWKVIGNVFDNPELLKEEK